MGACTRDGAVNASTGHGVEIYDGWKTDALVIGALDDLVCQGMFTVLLDACGESNDFFLGERRSRKGWAGYGK